MTGYFIHDKQGSTVQAPMADDSANAQRYLKLRARMVQTEPPIAQGHVGGASLDQVLDALTPLPRASEQADEAVKRDAQRWNRIECVLEEAQRNGDLSMGVEMEFDAVRAKEPK